jgi:hypothetical protein
VKKEEKKMKQIVMMRKMIDMPVYTIVVLKKVLHIQMKILIMKKI